MDTVILQLSSSQSLRKGPQQIIEDVKKNGDAFLPFYVSTIVQGEGGCNWDDISLGKLDSASPTRVVNSCVDSAYIRVSRPHPHIFSFVVSGDLSVHSGCPSLHPPRCGGLKVTPSILANTCESRTLSRIAFPTGE